MDLAELMKKLCDSTECFFNLGKEAANMTGYEIVSILVGILALLIAFGSFVITLLSFLEKKNR